MLNINHIKKNWEKLITRLLAFLLKGLLASGEFISFFSRQSAKTLAPAGRAFLRMIILPLYGYWLVIRAKFVRSSDKKKDRFILIFTNRHFVHILIIAIGIGVATSNLLGYENREDYGQNALMYRLSGMGAIEIIEDVSVVTDEVKIYNYQDRSLFIEGNSFADNQNSDSDNIYTDAATNQGDLALIKPDVINLSDASSGQTIKTVGGVKEYLVLEGDTISKISRKFGISVNTILWANNLASTSYVKPGQKLQIPSTSGVVHKVVRGDTLGRIAQKYSVTESVIRSSNDIEGDNLAVGQTLIIPGGKIIETAKPRPVVAKPGKTLARQPVGEKVVVSGTGRMSWPSACYRISQYFKGWRHTGLDIACPWGTPLRAADGGRVTRVQYGRTGYGYNVIIDHGNGIQTLYGHMSSIDVSVGQYVEKGEVIGAEGSTGRSTGPHVHFEVRIGGTMVNPLGYIR